MSHSMYDVAIVGGGPAGACCASACANAGLKVLVIERDKFPREKVCGDCMNPMAWSVIDAMGLQAEILGSTHVRLEGVRFEGVDGRTVRVPFPNTSLPKIAVARSLLDHILLKRAAESGAQVIEGSSLTGVQRNGMGWRIQTDSDRFETRQLVAADGRNSSTLRLLGLMPQRHPEERIALQARFPHGPKLANDVVLRFANEGYIGLAPVGGGIANLCLVTHPRNLPDLKRRAAFEYGVPASQQWRSITPLRRKPLPPTGEALWLVGDAARVVEPFTGEGIAYAMRTGMECARAILARDPDLYRKRHAALYSGRLWLNHLARQACLRPSLGSAFVRAGARFPSLLTLLTHKVVALA